MKTLVLYIVCQQTAIGQTLALCSISLLCNDAIICVESFTVEPKSKEKIDKKESEEKKKVGACYSI